MSTELISFKLEEKYQLDKKFFPAALVERITDFEGSRGKVTVFGFDGNLMYEDVCLDDVIGSLDFADEDAETFPEELINILRDCDLLEDL